MMIFQFVMSVYWRIDLHYVWISNIGWLTIKYWLTISNIWTCHIGKYLNIGWKTQNCHIGLPLQLDPIDIFIHIKGHP